MQESRIVKPIAILVICIQVLNLILVTVLEGAV